MLPSWTIYELPPDASARFMARRFENENPTEDVIMSNDLEQLRDALPKGLARFLRDKKDHSSILETWL